MGEYTKTELRKIAEELVEELRELDDGAETTANQLAKNYGYRDLDNEELLLLDDYLNKSAKANKITLERTGNNKAEVLPFNPAFVVRNKNAQIMCPRCGSTNTARYQYGYPAYSEDFQRKLDSGKIVLGGCCISSVDVNGEQVFDMPERFCNECKKDFGMPPILYNNKEEKYEDYRDVVNGISFSIGGYFGDFTNITIKKNKNGAIVHVDKPFVFPRNPDECLDLEDKQITLAKWNKIVSKLYEKIYIHEWNKDYTDIGVLDGTNWEVEITLEGRRKRTYSGSNAYPSNWSDFIRIFKEFSKFRYNYERK